MIKKIILIFICTFFLSYFLLQTFFKSLIHKQEAFDADQTAIILENVKDRFNLLLDLPLTVGVMGADYFSDGNLESKEYGQNAKLVLDINKDILGLNLVSAEGKIIQVYPFDENFRAKERLTQNFKFLLESYDRNERFWLSPPFKLYQNKVGFVFYVPIRSKQKLKGWFAPVISGELFFKKFKLKKYLTSFELIIKDAESGLSYFESSLAPAPGLKMHESSMLVMGRKLIFQSWAKHTPDSIRYPWYWSFFASLFLAGLASVTAKLAFNRRHARNQLRDISILLKLTSKEAISSLVELHSDTKNSEASKSIEYLKNLIEQIDLLQNMAQISPNPLDEIISVYPLLENQVTNFSDIIEKRGLSVHFNDDPKAKILVHANKWLLENSVFANILSHSIIFAKQNSVITISLRSSPTSHFISFQTEHVNEEISEGSALRFDRRLEVAQRVLQMYQGEMYIQRDMTGGVIIRIVLNRPE